MKNFILGVALSASCFFSIDTLQASEPVTAENHVVIDGREYISYGDMLVLNRPYSTMSEFDTGIDKWTNGEVFYQFDSAVTEENKQRFVEATKVWSDVAEVTFTERVDQSNHIYITNSTKNTATVGMVGGRQILTMLNWSNKYVIVHELGHTLGMWHEQQRTDRDAYVDILMENVLDDQRHNFNIKNTTTYSDYDFLSVMHYSSKAFTKNNEITVQPKPQYAEYTQYMGIRSHISGGDQLSIAMQYGAKTITINDASFKAYLLENFDTDGNGEIDTLEAATVKEIHTPGNGQINNIEGLAFFTSLSVLDVSDENLTTVPQLPYAVRQLDLSNNQLQTVTPDWAFPVLMNTITFTGNPIDEYACESIEFLKSTLAAGNVSYSPLANGSELVCNADSQFILASGKAKIDLRSKDQQTYNITVPVNANNLVIETSNSSQEIGGEMNVYVAYNRQPSATDFDYVSSNSGNIEFIEVTDPAAGVWYIQLAPVDRSFEYVDLVATFNSAPVINENNLINGQAVAGISAIKDDSVTYILQVPENASDLSFAISGGSGDADLYVRFAEAATLSHYDCRPWLGGNTETCAIENVQAGVYYVTLNAYAAFDGVSLVANFTEISNHNGGVFTQSDLAANAGKWLDMVIQIPEGMATLEVVISGGTGDADLYVRYNQQATSSLYDCRPYNDGNEEICTLAKPAAGTWYLSTQAYLSFTGLSLNAKWKP